MVTDIGGGVLVIDNKPIEDDRGFFNVKTSQELFERCSKDGSFTELTQINHSFSHKGVIRGLHFQRGPHQSKLVMCITGEILDVAVDIRAGSETYGKYVSAVLNEGKSIFIPPGFAHGFYARIASNVVYAVDGEWNPKGEGCIYYDDPDLAIDWRYHEKEPTMYIRVSDKDRAGMSWKKYQETPWFV